MLTRSTPRSAAEPDNTPLPEEIRRCQDHLDAELARLPHVRVVVALGRIAFAVWLQRLRRQGVAVSPKPRFAHGAVVPVSPVLIGCYHPSRQNTSTGKLTPTMIAGVFRTARRLLDR
jgi:uracil-DNA glycosylase